MILYREPPPSPIIHGNADIEQSMLGAESAPEPEPDLFPERDDLRDPELRLLSHAYNAALLASARPVAPEWDFEALPAEWNDGGPF